MQLSLKSAHARSLARGQHRPTAPIYYFDIVHDYPDIGGIVEFSNILLKQLQRRYGRRLVSARQAAVRLGVYNASLGYLPHERRVAEALAIADPDATFFFPNFQSPVARQAGAAGPRVVNVIHDVQFAALPELFSTQHLGWLDSAFAETQRNADHVVFISRASQRDYIARYGAPRRHEVIYNPIEIGAASDIDDGATVPFLLTAAHYHPHKNFSGLLALFTALAERDPVIELVVTGHGGEKFARHLDSLPDTVRRRVRHLGHVPRSTLDRLYRQARAFITLSRFEGFNMAAAEAASHGAPLILSDLPVHRELFGGQACFVEPAAPSVDRVSAYLAAQNGRVTWTLHATCAPARVARAYAKVLDAAGRKAKRRARLPVRLPCGAERLQDGVAARWPHRALASAMLVSSVLVSATAFGAPAPAPVWGAGGAGGGNLNRPDRETGVRPVRFGGAGGVGYMGMNGEDAGTSYYGGGGGASGGGAGGIGLSCGTPSHCPDDAMGGAGGTSMHPDGEDGQRVASNPLRGAGGGGGGGGFHGNGFTGVVGSADLTGGNGGRGGDGGDSHDLGWGAGGGGGGGGYGAVLVGSLELSIGTDIIAGNGGDGGNSTLAATQSFAGGGGGGGGVGIFFEQPGSSLATTGRVAGGQGGNGGDGGGNATGYAGHGGAGGAGITGDALTLRIDGSVSGGSGGDGGYGGESNGGNGGAGGAGIAGDDLDITVHGSVIGGDGGVASPGELMDGSHGLGGAGISGANLSIVNGGTIAGGLHGSGVRGDAITFLGGANTLSFLSTDTGLIGDIAIRAGSLTLGQDDIDLVIDNAITGDGDLIKSGAAKLTLNGANTYTGATYINEGVLHIGGSLASAVTINGGRLSGSGVVDTVTVGDGGLLTPGNSIGTLHVNTLTLQSGSTYEVEINDGGNTAGINNDLAVVTGTATINAGATILVVPENGTDTGESYAANTTYTIIQAGTLVVYAAPTVVNTLAFLDFTASYDAHNFYLTTGGAAASFCLPGASFNQCSTAEAVRDLGAGNSVYDAVLGMSGMDANTVFALASGEIHASGQHLIDQTFGLFGRLLRQQGSAGVGAGIASAQFTATPLAHGQSVPGSAGMVAIDAAAADEHAERTGRKAWLTPIGMRGSIDGNAEKLDWWSAGLAGGYEDALDVKRGQAYAGFGLGYIRSEASADARRSDFDSDGFHIGVYGGWSDGPWTVAGSLAYALNTISTERRMLFDKVDHKAEADYHSHTVGLSGEVLYGFDLGAGTTLSPLFTVDTGWSSRESFTEKGAGALDLAGGSEHWTRFDTGLGLALQHARFTEQGRLTLAGRAVWEHAFADIVPSQSLAFAGGPTDFEVRGPDAGRDRLRLGAGASFQATESLTLHAGYDGLFSGRYKSHTANFGFNLKF